MGVQPITVLVVLLSSLSICLGQDNGGSMCQGTSCIPAPGGAQCEARYERDDGCCPVWYCSNGQTVYGKSSSQSSGSFQSWSSSSSSGGGSPMMNMPGFNIQLPFFGRR